VKARAEEDAARATIVDRAAEELRAGRTASLVHSRNVRGISNGTFSSTPCQLRLRPFPRWLWSCAHSYPWPHPRARPGPGWGALVAKRASTRARSFVHRRGGCAYKRRCFTSAATLALEVDSPIARVIAIVVRRQKGRWHLAIIRSSTPFAGDYSAPSDDGKRLGNGAEAWAMARGVTPSRRRIARAM
jgi:hypothetical protein